MVHAGIFLGITEDVVYCVNSRYNTEFSDDMYLNSTGKCKIGSIAVQEEDGIYFISNMQICLKKIMNQ